jgi:hypothetical protein
VLGSAAAGGLALFLALSRGCPAFADAAVSVKIDGQPLTVSAAPVIKDGRTLVPMRDIFEALGATLLWDDATKTAAAVSKDGGTVKVAIGDKNAYVNGAAVEVEAPPEIIGGRAFVPLRFVAAACGARVSWDAASKTVLIDTSEDTDGELKKLFDAKISDVPARGKGTVARVLPDDDDGARHQRFIIKLESGQTLLAAHNIDIAPRLDGLKAGDEVEFSGEYVYNQEGGVIHWTHRDPDGNHAGGWLKWNGKTYD